MLRIGLTGGMGAGKSTVARILTELGGVLIDSDAIAREVVAPGTEGLAALVERFGDAILAADGSLDRPALAAIAFASDESRTALNGIVHPLVGKRTAELFAAAPADAVVVQDVPLLVENNLAPMTNLVLVVHAPAELRLRRLVEFRGVDEADARARIASQATDEQRRAAADVWLDNSGEPEALEPVVRALWSERLLPFERNLRTGTAAATDAVRLAEPDPEWPAQAQRLIARLRLACGGAALSIEHTGATSVPGLPAKDVLDIQITVPSLEVADGLRDGLTAAGFPVGEHRFDNPEPADGDPARWEKRLHNSADPGRPADISLRVADSPGARFAIAFRDALRADPELRAEYLAVERKAEAEAEGLTGRAAMDAYLAVEEPWFDEVYARLSAS
ncbi:dephospho-CoA kinase [Nocardia asteroides]|uniref:dephospho-CoA kinase n=1 Tax=Nocardia asteroides TaxID=1824 RepID=UPI001E2DEE9C|nr:dephospho-CoA kinase [Nocardia asteroides]UGT60828.1 dephospho-CoA kinase [Nocardia asteroides]